MILVVLENQRGIIHDFSLQAIVAGQQFANEYNCPLNILCLGENADNLKNQASKYECDSIMIAEHDLIKEYTSDGFSKALSDVIQDKKPQFTIMGHSYMARDFLPRVSVKQDIPFISDLTSVNFQNEKIVFSKQVFNAKFLTNIEIDSNVKNAILSFQSSAFSKDKLIFGTPKKIEKFNLSLDKKDIRIVSQEPFKETSSDVDLSSSEFIVTVGRGIESEDNLPIMEKFVDAIGADLGSSRPVVDMGILPKSRLVGSSGHTVAPNLYLAVGLSGAIQHVVAMKGSEKIMAINTDRDAPIFEVADYAVIGDLFEIIPELTRKISED